MGTESGTKKPSNQEITENDRAWKDNGKGEENSWV